MNRPADASDDGAPAPDGVLVVGHGTREPAGIAEFQAVVRQLVERLAPLPVESGFLELAEPTIAAGLNRLVERGARRIVVVPMLLFSAGHAKHDIPWALSVEGVRHPGMTWVQTDTLGLHPKLMELALIRYDEATKGGAATPDAETLLLLVGRGSSDAEAIAAMREFAALRAAARAVGRVEAAFAAVAEPRLETALAEVDESVFRRVVVQPYLLFSGELTDGIERLIGDVRSRRPILDIRSAAPLGPHPLLVDAVIGRIREVAEAWKPMLSDE